MQLASVQAHADVVCAAVTLAAAAMRWPDIHTQLRAVAVCRTVAAAGGAPLNPALQGAPSGRTAAASLQLLLVPCIFTEAVRALAIANEGHLTSELLLLIRSVYIACAGWQPGPLQQLQSMLPSVTQDSYAQVRLRMVFCFY
jgi:hypothetical protein